MPIKLAEPIPEKGRWIPIKIDDDTSFEILLRRPDADDVIGEYGSRLSAGSDLATAAAATHRIKRAVKDWRGVTDANDQPIKYTTEAMARLIEQVPYAIHPLMRAVNDAWLGLLESERKNLSAPSDDISTEILTATPISTSVSGDGTESSPMPPSQPESPPTS